MLINDTSTTSKRSLWPDRTRDLWVVGAMGSNLWLTDNRVYVDWCMDLGACTLGYQYASAQPAYSLPSAQESLYAQELCVATNQQAVRFVKNGSDAMSCAVRLARYYGRQNSKTPYVGVFDACYHGSGDWFGPNTWTQGGLEHINDLVVMKWGEELPDRAKSMSAICIEPIPRAIQIPTDEWIQYVVDYCHTHNVLLISDEVVLGFRDSIEGSMQSRYKVLPDIQAMGKAMGQGFAIAAVLGRQDIMKALEHDVHYSNTNNGETTGLMMGRTVLQLYMGNDIVDILKRRGQSFQDVLHEHDIQTRGIESRFEITFSSEDKKKDCIDYCFSHGHIFPGFVCLALTHRDDHCEELIQLLLAWRSQNGF